MHGPCSVPVPFRAGDVVRIRDERWRITNVAPYEGCTVLTVSGAGDDNRGIAARFVLPFEPAERIAEPSTIPRPLGAAAFRRAVRRMLADATPKWTSLRAAARARIALLPFQLEPAIAMARGLASRSLLADEVGLGKTIQAGLIAAEVLAANADARILIVTPAALREQWRDELRDRFDIAAEVFDAAGLAQHASQLPPGRNPWAATRVVLTSIDFLKRPDVIRSLEPLVWDLVVFDEAHALCGRSDRAAAADMLARRGRRVVAVTATPHSGDPRAFDRLCALGALDADPILLFRRSRAEAGVPARRVARLLQVRLHSTEQAAHRALDEYARRVWREAPPASAAAARLAMIVLARRACSSAASLAASIERRLALLDDRAVEASAQLELPLGVEPSADAAPDAELSAPGFGDGEAERTHLERIARLARAAAEHESKIAALRRLLRRTREPVLVFTEYRDTLERLKAALEGSAAGSVAVLHGGQTHRERSIEARRFTHGDARLLLATDAASEGLNLHQRCRLVINLEVPWTPLRVEQRIGRVDRLDQARRVHAIGLVARRTVEQSIAAALLGRAARAASEAPFSAEARQHGRCFRTVDLREAAVAETARLETSRALAGPAACSAGARARPIVCVLTRRRAQVYWCVRITFGDASGTVLWETLVAPTVSAAGVPHRPAAAVRAWWAALQAAAGREFDAVAAAAQSALAEQQGQHVHEAVRRFIAREKAILRAVQASGGRLAAPLVQAGLFDRRALRDAEAQRRVAAATEAAARQEILRLQRMAEAGPGERRLLFVAAV